MRKPNRLFSSVLAIFVLYPPIFSIAFSLAGLAIPSNLFGMIVAVTVLILSNRFSFKAYPYFDKKIFLATLLFSIIYISTIYTASTEAWLEKTVFISYTIVAPILLIFTAYFSKPDCPSTLTHLESILYQHAIVLIWLISVCLLFFSIKDESGRLMLPGIPNTIWVARYIGVLVIVVFCSSYRNDRAQLMPSATLGIGLLCMLIVGSRTPVLALLLVFIIYQYNRAGKYAMLLTFSAILTILTASYFVIGGYLFETDFYSIYDRFEILSAFSEPTSFPLMGHGIGSFGIVTTGTDFYFYPHNLFAEVFFEQGLIGLVVLLLLVAFVFKSFDSNTVNYLLIYTFIGSLSSGDIPGNSLFFILVFVSALPFAARRINKRTR